MISGHVLDTPVLETKTSHYAFGNQTIQVRFPHIQPYKIQFVSIGAMPGQTHTRISRIPAFPGRTELCKRHILHNTRSLCQA